MRKSSKYILLHETSLSTAGHEVWHLYKANEKADGKKLAELLFHDDGSSWDTINKVGWDVKCIASTEYGDDRIPEGIVITEEYFEGDFG